MRKLYRRPQSVAFMQHKAVRYLPNVDLGKWLKSNLKEEAATENTEATTIQFSHIKRRSMHKRNASKKRKRSYWFQKKAIRKLPYIEIHELLKRTTASEEKHQKQHNVDKSKEISNSQELNSQNLPLASESEFHCTERIPRDTTTPVNKPLDDTTIVSDVPVFENSASEATIISNKTSIAPECGAGRYTNEVEERPQTLKLKAKLTGSLKLSKPLKCVGGQIKLPDGKLWKIVTFQPPPPPPRNNQESAITNIKLESHDVSPCNENANEAEKFKFKPSRDTDEEPKTNKKPKYSISFKSRKIPQVKEKEDAWIDRAERKRQIAQYEAAKKIWGLPNDDDEWNRRMREKITGEVSSDTKLTERGTADSSEDEVMLYIIICRLFIN